MFIQIGSKVLNTDAIAYVDLQAKDWNGNPCVRVHMRVTTGGDEQFEPDYLDFYGSNASRVRNFLTYAECKELPIRILSAIDVPAPKALAQSGPA